MVQKIIPSLISVIAAQIYDNLGEKGKGDFCNHSYVCSRGLDAKPLVR